MDVTTSPWGPVQHQEQIAEGIVRVLTAGHGGLVLSPVRLHAMPKQYKLNIYGTGRYFEEDCEWALVVLAFPDVFTPEQRDAAYLTAKQYYPSLRLSPSPA